MTEAEAQELQKLVDTIKLLLRPRKGAFTLSVTPLAAGRFKVDLGPYGNAELFNFQQLTLYLAGIAQGMILNK